ncbi:MAG: signal peptidase I [bacterium]
MEKKKTSKEKKESKEKEGTSPQTWKEKIIAGLKEVGIVLGAFLVLNNFVIASFLVPTGSMENEVMTGDFLFVNKFIYGGTSPRNIPFTNVRLPWFRVPKFRDVERKDVIVFVWPGNRDDITSEDFMFYLKRCVGLPGDTIKVVNRVLFVNGTQFTIPRNIKFDSHMPLPETFRDERIFPKGAPFNEDHFGPLVVPFKGMKVVLSAEHFEVWDTFIKREGHSIRLNNGNVEIDNQAVTEYTVQQDYLFGMGDHRDNSLDSRYWGFIPKDNLVGTPLIVYWSWDTSLPLYDIFGKLASVRLGRIGTLID